MGGFFIRIFLPLFYGGVGVVYGDIQPVFLFFLLSFLDHASCWNIPIQ